MLSYNELGVLFPSESGARKMSGNVVHNIVVRMTQRWEQHVYVAHLQHLQSLLMKAVLRGRWAKQRDCLTYNVHGHFQCLKWRILLGVLHQILRNIYNFTLLTKGTSRLLQREKSTLRALQKINAIPKAANYARCKPAITSPYVAQLEGVLSRNSEAAVIVESSD